MKEHIETGSLRFCRLSLKSQIGAALPGSF